MSGPEKNTMVQEGKSYPDDLSDVQPSWRPLIWVVGSLVAVIGLWELFLDLGMDLFELIWEILERVWLVLVEAPEEFLEDLLADWLKNHFPREAHRYSEVATAIGLTPLKIFLVFLLARWGWRHSRTKLWPRICVWFNVRVTQVRLAWGQLWWPYRVLGGVVLIGVLVVLI